MGDRSRTKVIHTRVPEILEKKLLRLVEEGHYSNISDALREAARKLVDNHPEITEVPVKPVFELHDYPL